ncbi:MAG: FAD-dependent oxidoreductase [Gemmatimonadaceae bacterium]
MRRLLLVGGGHAHLEVVRTLIRQPLDGVELLLISRSRQHHYSGMIPGYLQGTYDEHELVFDLPALCSAMGAGRARFIEASAERVSPVDRVVEAGGERYEFDIASLDVGSSAIGRELPGVEEYAHTVIPMSGATALRDRVESLAAERSGQTVAVCVVGGGAGGVEVASALHRRLREAGATARVTLIESGDALLSEFTPRAGEIAHDVLSERGITVRTGTSVARVESREVALESGERIASDLTVWLTGAAAPRLLTASPLSRDADGFLLVDDNLRSVDGAPLWGAGDCVTLRAHPDTPKAGVVAVRQAPVLAANLRAAVGGGGGTCGGGGGAPRRYEPQRRFLALLNTADGRALLAWDRIAVHSRIAWRLKDYIDRRFMRRYQGLEA